MEKHFHFTNPPLLPTHLIHVVPVLKFQILIWWTWSIRHQYRVSKTSKRKNL